MPRALGAMASAAMIKKRGIAAPRDWHFRALRGWRASTGASGPAPDADALPLLGPGDGYLKARARWP